MNPSTCNGDAPEDSPPDAGQPIPCLEGEQVPCGKPYHPEANDVEPHQGGLPPKTPAGTKFPLSQPLMYHYTFSGQL